MKATVTYPDVEIEVKDLLRYLIASHEPTVTVSVGVPSTWKPSSPPHIEVALDTTDTSEHPVASRSLVRIVARSNSTSRSKELANLAHGLLCGYDGDDLISGIRPALGLIPARDPDTRAELASVTVRVTTRSIPIS